MLALSLLFALISAPSQPAKLKVKHEGPWDLKWGTPIGEARASLDQKLEFVSERADPGMGSLMLLYSGRFADEVADKIEVHFVNGNLEAIAVQYPSTDDRHPSRTWELLVEKMTRRYGKPSKIQGPPNDRKYSDLFARGSSTRLRAAAESIDEWRASVRYTVLDQMIASGEWDPRAAWLFANDVTAMVMVATGDPDELGTRELQPSWMFITKAAMTAAKSAPEKSDF